MSSHAREALIASLEAEIQSAHRALDTLSIGGTSPLSLGRRVHLAVTELEALRRRVALLTVDIRPSQLGDDEGLEPDEIV